MDILGKLRLRDFAVFCRGGSGSGVPQGPLGSPVVFSLTVAVRHLTKVREKTHGKFSRNSPSSTSRVCGASARLRTEVSPPILHCRQGFCAVNIVQGPRLGSGLGSVTSILDTFCPPSKTLF